MREICISSLIYLQDLQAGLNLLADEKISVSSESAVIEQKLDSLHSLLQSQINAGASRKNSMRLMMKKSVMTLQLNALPGKKL